MNLGFSTLSLFMKSIDEMLNIAIDDGFNIIELLSEGPYIPSNLLENQDLLEPFHSYDIGVYIHAPTVDLNLASLNSGIRAESVRQTKQCLDLAELIGAKAITVHPGKVGRKEERIRTMGLTFAEESIKELVDYTEDKEVKLSVENMPERFSFLGNRPEELENFTNNTGCSITIDLGHANTCDNPDDFMKIPNIEYCHLNDNDGIKDQHVSLGEGTLDLNLLKKVDNGIIELNKYENVLKSKKVIDDFLG